MSNVRQYILLVVVLVYSSAVFALDLLTPLGIEVWVLNLPVLIVPVWLRQARLVVVFGFVSSGLLIVAWLCSPPGGHNPPLWDVLNRAMGLATIWLIALMAINLINRTRELGDALDSLRRETAQRERLERQAAERETLAIAAREQERIGQELHDGVGQEVTGLALMAEALAERLAAGSKEHHIAARLVAGLESVHRQVRELSRGLIPVHLESRGLAAALDDLAARTAKSAGIEVTADCPDGVELPDHETATHLFRIAQEAVGNAVKHGRPRQVRIDLHAEASRLRLRVADDGVGLSEGSTRGDGLGLRIMRNRAGQIGGALEIGPAPGGGTVVACTVPVGESGEDDRGNDGES